MKNKICLLLITVCLTGEIVAQKTVTLPLYKTSVPNSLIKTNTERVTITNGIPVIEKVNFPSMDIYRPAKPNGTAVIICPGGGYQFLAADHEGKRVAEEFIQWGVTAFVLRYRLPDDSLDKDKSMAPLQDAQQAVRLVRSNASRWGIDRHHIGIMGFSAGGHLASTAATHFNIKADPGNEDTTSARPDFAVLIYPVISFDSAITHMGSRVHLLGNAASAEKVAFFSNDRQVSRETPPVFLVHAGDDKGVPVANSIRFYEACILNGVLVEMHLYPKGGHGFGMNNKTTNDRWMDRLKNWMDRL